MTPRSAKRPAEPLPLFEPADRAELRAWLEANHADSSGIQLAVGKRRAGTTSLRYEEAVEEALAYGWIDSTAHRLDDDRFTVLFTPRRPGSIWARSNKARVGRLTAAGLMAASGLAVVEAAKADGSWNSLDDVEDLVVPDDLAVALEAQPEAARRFMGMADSRRKQELYWISSAKRPETRAERIAQVVKAAAEGRRLT